MSFLLRPAAPFDFAHTLAALAGFRASPDTRRIDERAFTQGWRLAAPDGELCLVTVRSLGDVDAPLLEVETDASLDAAREAALAARLRRSLALDLDASHLEAVDDPAFAPVLEALRGYHPPLFPSAFEAACWTVLRQRTPYPFAVASMARLAALLGDERSLAGEPFTLFPSPGKVGDEARAALLAATNNTRKVDRLVPLARAFALLDEAWLQSASYDEARAWLLRLPGVGPWSAETVLVSALGRYERTPWTDTGALPAIQRVYAGGLSIPRGSARELAERYGWLQGLWLAYLKRFVYALGQA